MNIRQKEILKILIIEKNKYLLIQEIAEKVGCSEKTIRNDFKTIEGFLSEHSHATLVRKPGIGVMIDIKRDERSWLYDYLLLENQPLISDEERLMEISFQLLMTTKSLTLQELSSQFYTNKAVIKKDVMVVEEWLRQFKISIVFKQKIGLVIEGQEMDKRKAVSKLSQLKNYSTSSLDLIKGQFAEHEVEAVKRELKWLQKSYMLSYTDESNESLLIHILILIKRTKLKQQIKLSKNEQDLVKNKKEYEMSTELLTKLQSVFAVRFPEEEVTYLALHFLGGKFLDYPQGNDPSEHPILLKVVEKLLEQMSNISLIPFKKDTDLLQGLILHLYSTLNRLLSGLSVSNPMLQDIKKMYPYMFDNVISVIEEINEKFNLTIPEEEAAYLTLHFQASIERLRKQQPKLKNVVIVCHMGIGMSQLLRTKLERKVEGFHIIDCISKSELESFLSKEDIDLIISTIPLEETTIPHIVLSPLFEEREERRLLQFLQQLKKEKYSQKKEKMLEKYTKPSLVFLQMEKEHRYEIIEELAQALYIQGYVEKEYAHQSIKREQMSSTGIGAGIAIPHGHPSLIKKSAIAIATLNRPLDWGGEKVSLVFMLAVVNEEKEETKQLFRELSSITAQPAVLQELLCLNDRKSFIEVLSS